MKRKKNRIEITTSFCGKKVNTSWASVGRDNQGWKGHVSEGQ
jgi:hypothetical protein